MHQTLKTSLLFPVGGDIAFWLFISSTWAAAAAKSLQLCLTGWPHRRQSTRLPRPWGCPGKNTGVGCHFLLQCTRVRNESEVAQLCLTPRDPMDCSLLGSSVHGIFQARVLEWGAIAFSELLLLVCFLILFFNWRIIALQYCVSFCHTSALISHRYTYVPSLQNLPPPSHIPLLLFGSCF